MINKHLSDNPSYPMQRAAWVVLKSKVEHEREAFHKAREELFRVFQLITASSTRHITFSVEQIRRDVDTNHIKTSESHVKNLQHLQRVEAVVSSIPDSVNELGEQLQRSLTVIKEDHATGSRQLHEMRTVSAISRVLSSYWQQVWIRILILPAKTQMKFRFCCRL
jgi:hypothetical protein